MRATYPLTYWINLSTGKVIAMLTFTPHCSHKLQPIDGRLEKYYNTACNEWQIKHPGKAITIYDGSENLGKAFPKPENITARFRAMGIHPIYRNIFHDDEFLSACVMDRSAEPANEEVEPERETRCNESIKGRAKGTTPGMPSISYRTTTRNKWRVLPDLPHQSTSPEDVRPYPKAGARKKK